MKLIKELNERVEILTENTEHGKSLYIEGVFLQAEVVNRNQRLYPKGIMEAEVNRYRNTMVAERRAYGELDHKSGPNIETERISHHIISLEERGNDYIGKALISNNPLGLIVQNLIAEGGRLGTSSRALGDVVVQEGVGVVQDNFMLITASDIVVNPSAPNAFIDGLMEGVEWICESGVWTQVKIAEAQQVIHTASRSELEAKKLALLESFLKDL